MPAIEVSHLTKEYRLGALQSVKQTLLKTGARVLGRQVEEPPLFKALDDVNFSIEPGEVVGIIGHNGAGKSTLLKMLARISTPTSGSVTVNGRIAPLIEVGAGFVSDFTGRENVYLNGSILGMPKKEIDRKFDEIVDFAEMTEFIDTPVKRYSSGMQVKLAFAVATSVESDILIVDEVLAVGDLAFQRKCFDRMETLIKRQQRTVLLVSHNIRQVERLCSRVLLLNRGKLIADGEPTPVCNQFFEESDAKIQLQLQQNRPKGIVNSDTGSDVELLDISIADAGGASVDSVTHGQDISVRLRYRIHRPIERPTFALGIHTPDLLYLASKDTGPEFRSITITDEIFDVSCILRQFPFLPGSYALRACVAQGDGIIFYAENLHPFVVTAKHGSRADMSEEGFVRLRTEWILPSLTNAQSNNRSTTFVPSK